MDVIKPTNGQVIGRVSLADLENGKPLPIAVPASLKD